MPCANTGTELRVELHACSGGDRGPTLLCLHGFGDNHHSWSALRAIVAPGGQRLVAVDLPGFGRSPLPPAFATNYSLQAIELVLRLVREELPGPVILIGNSLGGAVGLGAAIRDADRGGRSFAGLLLIAPATPRTRTPLFMRLLRFPAYRWADGIAARMATGPRRAAARMVARVGFRTMLAPGVHPSPTWFDAVTASFERPGAFLDLEKVAQDTRAVLRGEVHGIEELMRGTARVRVPVLLMRGELDRVISRAELEELASTLPDARYVEVPGIGHCPQNEDPEETFRLVRELTARCTAAGRGGDEGIAPGGIAPGETAPGERDGRARTP